MRADELVAAARRGDPVAFAALVDAARPRVTPVVERMLGDPDEAEDVVQEALVRAYLGLSQLRDAPRFGSWLCGIAVNVAKMRLRRRAAERRALVRAVSAAPASASEPEERALLQLVQHAVELLPRGQRDVVLMHYVDGLSCDEIAALLGRSPGAVRVGLHRARAQLREQLAALAPVTAEVKEEIVMIEMVLEDVLVRVAEDDPGRVTWDGRIVVLREKEGERVLPIWIGAAEGNALALTLTDERTPRPVTSDLMAELVRATGRRVERVAVAALRESTFYATIAVAVDGRVEELDARPSDALNLAVRVGAPVFAAEDVLERSATTASELPGELDKRHESYPEPPPGRWASLSAELLRRFYERPQRR